MIMKHLIICLLTAALLLGVVLPVRADDKTDPSPNASFGFAGSYGWYNNWQLKPGDMNMKTESAPGYGGAFIFEKMFNNYLGIHGGFWFNQMNMVLLIKGNNNSGSTDPMSLFYTRMDISSWTISFPLSLVTSLNASFFSFQIHTGIKYTQILTSEMTNNNPYLTVFRSHMDMMSLINPTQFGFTLGLFFKFRTPGYVDLFFGAEGELYVTQLIKENNDITHLFALTIQAGIMFRTNVFPIPAARPAL
jgi:hypothetical protein